MTTLYWINVLTDISGRWNLNAWHSQLRMPASGASIGAGRRLGEQSRKDQSRPAGPSPEQIEENQKRQAAQVEEEQQAEDDALAKALGLGPDFVAKQRTYRPLRAAFFAHQAELNAAEGETPERRKEISDRYLGAKRDFDAAQAELEQAEKEGLVGRAREGDVEAVRALLSKDGVDLNTRDSTGDRALTAAISGKDECSHAKMLEFLLAQEDIDVNSPSGGCPPLHHAAYAGSSECVALLIKHKDISMDQQYNCFGNKWSAMQVAQSYTDSKEHAEVVTQLKGAGATEFSSSCCVLS